MINMLTGCCCCYQVSSEVSDSVRPHRRQPTRLSRWDSPGKNTGVGCHFLLQGMKVKNESEVAQSCLTLLDLPSSSIHGIFQARALQCVAIAFSTLTQEISKAIMLTGKCRLKRLHTIQFYCYEFSQKRQNYEGQRTNQWLLEDGGLRVRV